MKHHPPRLAEQLLRRALPFHNRDVILGDLMEQYTRPMYGDAFAPGCGTGGRSRRLPQRVSPSFAESPRVTC
jgi:hypothetical protein